MWPLKVREVCGRIERDKGVIALLFGKGLVLSTTAGENKALFNRFLRVIAAVHFGIWI